MSDGKSDSVFLSSVTDLMTSLAVIFILLLIFFIKQEYSEAARAEAANRRAEAAKQTAEDATKKANAAMKALHQALLSTKSMKELLKRRLAEKGYPAEDDPRDSLAVVYHAGSDKLQFDVDLVDLKTEGKDYLNKFIPALASVVADREIFPALRSILIEGHTDSDDDDEHNLPLSQGRAFSVLKYGLSECRLSPYLRDRLLDLCSINGRGERDLLPTGSRAGREDKTRSRRVEFKIRVRSFEEKDKDIRDSILKETDKSEGVPRGRMSSYWMRRNIRAAGTPRQRTLIQFG